MPQLPLDRFEVLHTNDLDLARETVGKIFCPHKLELVGRDTRLDARMHSRRCRNVALNYAAYGGEVRVDPGELGNFYVVEIAVAGKGVIHSGTRQTHLLPGRAAVVGPTDPLKQRLSATFEQVVVRIERTALEAHLSDLIGGPLARPLNFRLDMDLVQGYGRSWASLASYWVADANRTTCMLNGHPLLINTFEQNLMTGLLLAQPSNYSAQLDSPMPAAGSRAVSTAIDLIEGHPEWEHSPASLARAANVSVRSLQKAFRRDLDTSLLEYLRATRLRNAHDHLLTARPDADTVTAVANRWGFAHPGRFSIWYRQQFGESPSQTLHRRSG